MHLQEIEDYYRANRATMVKRMGWRCGVPELGEDIVHTAFERAIRYRRNCRDGFLPQWFSMLLNNALRDHQNAEKGYSPMGDDVEDVGETNSCPHYPTHIMREIFELIDTKSVVQIEVLSLHFREEYSAKDISAITNYSYAQCHQIIQRFRNELKELYHDA